MRSPSASPRSRRLARCVTALTLTLTACSGDGGPPAPIQPPPGNQPSPRFQTGVPPGWYGGTGSGAYDAGIDVGVRRTGQAAAYLTARRTPGRDQFAFIGQTIAAEPWRGKRVRLAAWVRADSLAVGAGLWMRIDGARGTLAFDNQFTTNRSITGSGDWQRHEVVLDVPEAGLTINFGGQMSGTGTMRIDDAVLEVVDASVPATSGTIEPSGSVDTTAAGSAQRLPVSPSNMDFEGLPATESAWLATVARPFATDAPGSALTDLSELGAIVGTARIVGFGEATHGTREFFRMKHRAFEYLVEEQGFTHFTIEATMPESRAMDRYVTLGEGDPARLLSNLYFWTWNTQEVLDLVRWMRAYNVRVGQPRLRFVGFDMQAPQQAIDSTVRMLARVDTALRTRAQRTVDCLAPGRSPEGTYTTARYQGATTLAAQTACVDSLQALLATVETARPAWAGRMPADDLDWLVQYVRLVWQWARLGRATADAFAVRDQAMAENIGWTAAREPAARLFAWAHNAHVSRRAPAMGSNLARAFGDGYRNLAFTFGTGTFNAVGSTGASFTTLGPQTVGAVPTWSLESAFQATAQPRLIFDARRIAAGGDAAASLRNQPLRLRSIGSVYAESSPASYFEQMRIPEDYDGLIWFATTSPSVLLPFIR